MKLTMQGYHVPVMQKDGLQLSVPSQGSELIEMQTHFHVSLNKWQGIIKRALGDYTETPMGLLLDA